MNLFLAWQFTIGFEGKLERNAVGSSDLLLSMQNLQRQLSRAYFSQIMWASAFLTVLVQLARPEGLWKLTHMLLDRNLGVECARIPRFRHSHRAFCYFLKSQRENGKDTYLFYGTANTEGSSLPIPRGLSTYEPPAEFILPRWMMSSWQQPHQRP